MTGPLTFTMIKPDAMQRGQMGEILATIERHGFKVRAMKMLHLTKKDAEKFYAIHAEKSFFDDLCEFMSSGPILAAILEHENAVEAFRQLIGATDPSKAEPGTIRKIFATSVQQNAIHGSDSDENVIVESEFFFSKLERFQL